jgi:hypothetical protein
VELVELFQFQRQQRWLKTRHRPDFFFPKDRVTPVTKGTRRSLVLFIEGPAFI